MPTSTAHQQEGSTPLETNTGSTGQAQGTPAQLAAARSEHWHQTENAVLSVEAVRDWLSRSGLVLYAPRAQQLGAPAPSLVEATLGRAELTPELAENEEAKSLLARLIADGSAVPLNLLGATGGLGTDVPDFVVSAGVFSYIFTLRGNKAWKQSPVTSGAVKVSPLALAAHELLVEKVTLNVYDLTTHLGSGVTEAAALRALTELWSQLRVIPVPQQDGSPTLWELATARFTKQIKSGANAGQPTALSALISLYLGQAMAATEDEIESFLSPLAPRSRVRDVIHALLSARQLDTLVVEGKTLLHVAGDVPKFAAPAAASGAPAADGEEVPTEGEEGTGSRIGKFAARPGSKIGTGLRSKPAFGGKPAFGKKPAFGGGDRERRPFKKDDRAGGGGSDRPRFDRPWQENRPARPASAGSEGGAPERRSFPPRPEGGAGRPDRPQFGNRFAPKPRFEGRQEGFSGGSNAAGDSRPPRREFSPRPDGDGPRKTFSKPGTFGRKREGFAGKPTFGGGDARPPRRDFGGGDSRPPRRDFAAGAERPPRRDFGGSDARSEGDKKPYEGSVRRPGSYAPKPGGFGNRPSFGRDRPAGGDGEAPKRVFRKFDAPRDKKPFGDRPAKPFGAKPFGAKPFWGSSGAFLWRSSKRRWQRSSAS